MNVSLIMSKFIRACIMNCRKNAIIISSAWIDIIVRL